MIVFDDITKMNQSAGPDDFLAVNHSPTYNNVTREACVSDDVTFNFYINFIIIGALCICGIVGNTLSIMVLRKDPHNKVAIFLLQSLAVADNLLLLVALIVLSIWTGLLPYLSDHADWIHMSKIYLPIIMDPVGAIAQTATVWFTVLLALNRFIAVCKPFQAQTLCTFRRAQIQVATVVLLAVCFNIPMFFQYTIVRNDENGTAVDVYIEPSAIGADSMFGIVYTNALYTVLVLLLPLLLLIVLNTQLIREMRASRKRASSVSGRYGMVAPCEDNISLIMIIIIVVFIVCQTPDRIYQILNLVIFTQPQCNTVKSKLQAFCNLFIIVNSSTNFIIYYLFRKSFRTILKQRICAMPGFRVADWESREQKQMKLLHTCVSDGNIRKMVPNCQNGSIPVHRVASNPLLTTSS